VDAKPEGSVLTSSSGEPIEIGDDPTALYRLYGKDSELLYVGITGTPGQRMTQHANTQSWWPGVVRKTMVWYPTRGDACDAEATAIDVEKPKYNLRKNTNHSAAQQTGPCRSPTLKDLEAIYRATGVADLESIGLVVRTGGRMFD
jgi:hypothetical protein